VYKNQYEIRPTIISSTNNLNKHEQCEAVRELVEEAPVHCPAFSL